MRESFSIVSLGDESTIMKRLGLHQRPGTKLGLAQAAPSLRPALAQHQVTGSFAAPDHWQHLVSLITLPISLLTVRSIPTIPIGSTPLLPDL